jgi:proteasome lid subunit RPN8/RPN11
MSVRLGPSALQAIRREAARAYPHEACGALIGASHAEVSEALPLSNREAASPATRFTIGPADYLSVEQAAEARGAQLVGFWHSHPDHAARPSATDREHAWEGLLTIVVSVRQGEPREITAWSVPGRGLPFAEVPLSLEEV